MVERYNVMKEKAAQDKWEEVAWKEVVSKRVLQHYTYWQDQVKKEDNPQEFTRNLLRETKMPHLQEMAETALYFLPGGYTWRDGGAIMTGPGATGALPGPWRRPRGGLKAQYEPGFWVICRKMSFGQE